VGGSAPWDTTNFYRSRDCGARAYGAPVIDEWAEDRPKWEQIADVIRQRIADGTYPPRSRVPSVQQIVTETGVAVDTAQKVLANLREEGVIYTVRGLGSFVAEQA
jgi:GntR family transcriptional regulator